MTELATDGSIQETDYKGRKPLYQAIGKQVVLRRPLPVEDISESPHITESDKRFTQLLMELQENYGIHAPNISLFKARNSEDHDDVYIAGEWVEGKNLSDEASEIPSPVVKNALESIMRYYQEAAVKGGAYLSDLKPSNMIYGRTAHDIADQLYFVDMEPIWKGSEERHPLSIIHMDRIIPEVWLLIQEGQRNGQKWDDLEQEFDELVSGVVEAS